MISMKFTTQEEKQDMIIKKNALFEFGRAMLNSILGVEIHI